MRIILFFVALIFLISCQNGKSSQEKNVEVSTEVKFNEEVLNIGKMHCEMCVASIEKGLGSVEGVEYVKANLGDSTALIRYDASKTNISEFRAVIEKRGYILKNKELGN
jgi:copper chaperone